MKKPRVVTFGEVFNDPDMVGQSEYRAIYDVIVDGAFNGSVPDDDHVLTSEEAEHTLSMLTELKDLAADLRKELKK